MVKYRILLLLGEEKNRNILADLLGERYQIWFYEKVQDLNESFDLCIVDGLVLEKYQQQIQKIRKKEKNPVLLPILLLVNPHSIGIVTNQLWQLVDELLITPTENLELFSQIEVLLRARQLSLELKAAMEREQLLAKQLEEANEELHRLVFVDSLTQVANRRYFDRYIEQEWKRLTREKAPLSLIFCDIDFFKAYNDTYGHQAGDKCIAQVAQILSQAARRPADLVARYGGEEFTLVLPNTSAQGAIYVAEVIREEMKAKAIPHIASPIAGVVTISLGVATTIPSHCQSPETLIFKADEALYQAKKTGRDAAVLARDSENINS
jgi:diguanylate cyclase (GGDEF)-like protein